MAREFDPGSLKPGIPTAGQPPRPAGVLPEDAYEVEVLRTESDGTKMLNGATQVSRYPSELRSSSFPTSGPPVLTLSPRDAAMLGLFKLVQGLRWPSYDMQTIAEKGSTRATVTSHKLERVFLDWPDAQKEAMPAGTALITGPDECELDYTSETRLLTKTRDRFYPDTVLRYLSVQTVPLELIFWCAHKDQRRGLEAKVMQLLVAERHDDRQGRRIQMPEYFGQTIRYMLTSTQRPDSEVAARSNEWVLGVSLVAEAPHVELVWSPGVVESVQIDVEAGS